MTNPSKAWRPALIATALLASAWSALPAAAEEPAWTFETVQAVPAGCSGPTVRLTGFGQDDQERLVAGWQESSGCGGPITYRWARAEAGAWAVNTIVDHTCGFLECIGLRGAPAALAVSDDGRPFYAYAAPAGTLFGLRAIAAHLVDLSASPAGPGMNGQTIETYNNCYSAFPKFALDFAPGAASPDIALGVQCSAAGWLSLNGATVQGSPRFKPSAGKAGDIHSLDLATGADGGMHLTYFVQRGGGQFGAAYSNGSPGHEVFLAKPHLNRIAETSVAVGADGRIHVAVGGIPCCANTFEGGLLYLTSADGGATWARAFVDTVSGRHPSIALDAQGDPSISYFRHQQLRLGSLDQGGWCSQPIAQNANDAFGPNTRLLFDPQDRARVLYFDNQARALKVATGAAADCAGTHLPSIGAVADRTDTEQDVVALQLSASDADGGALTMTVTGLPPGLAFDAATRTIRGVIDYSANTLCPGCFGGPLATYTVVISASDGTNQQCEFFVWSVANLNRPPVADARTDWEPPRRVLLGQEVRFNDFSRDPDGDSLSLRQWRLGDEVLQSGGPLLKRFTTSGTKCITLLVRDWWGAEGTDTVCVYVNDPPVAVAASSPALTNLGLDVDFDGTGSSDSDGHIVAYDWTVDGAPASTQPSFARSFLAVGDHCAILVVEDNNTALSDAVRGQPGTCTTVTDQLTTDLAMTKAVYAPSEAAEGSVLVRYVTLQPVPAGVAVEVHVEYHSGDAGLDAALAELGCTTWDAPLTTDAAGGVSFVVPGLVERCLALGPLGLADLPTAGEGRYEVTAAAGDAFGNHGEDATSYEVNADPLLPR